MNQPVMRRILALVLLISVVLGSPVCPASRAQSPLTTIDLGVEGRGIAADWGTGRIWVAVEGQLRAYDARTLAPAATITLPQNYYACGEVAINQVTHRAYVVGSRTYVVDIQANAVLANLGQGGSEVVVNPTTNRVYMAYYSNHTYAVRVLNGADNSWQPDIPVATTTSYTVYWVRLAVNPNLNRVYVTYSEDDSLRVLDGNTHQELTRMTFEDIGYVAVDPNTWRVYVETGDDGVAVLDGVSHARLATIAHLHGPLRISPWTKRLYGAEWGSVTRLRCASLASNTVVGHSLLEGYNVSYAVDPTTGRLFVTTRDPAEWRKTLRVIQDASITTPAPASALPKVIASAALPADGRSVAVNATTNRVYVGVTGGVAIYDSVSLAQVGYVNLTDGTYAPPSDDICVDETRNRIYTVSDYGLYAIDGATNGLLGKITGGDRVAVNSTNGRVYVADASPFLGHPDVVRVVDGPSLSSVRTIKLGTSIYFQSVSVAVNPTTGYAYATYSADDNLHIISPLTDDLMGEVDFDSAGYMAVNPAANRVYVQVTSGGKRGVVLLDGNSHAQLGFFTYFPGQIATNPLTNRLYGREGTGSELFSFADGTSGAVLALALVDGDVHDYAVHPGLARLYAVVSEETYGPARELVVIQDEGSSLPTPTPTPTRTPVPLPSFTPTDRLYLPALLRM